MIKSLLLRPGLIAGPLHSTPLQIISQSIPRLDPIDSKSSYWPLIGQPIRGLEKIRHDQWIPGKILPHFDPSYLSVGQI